MKHASRQQISAPERTKTGAGKQENNGEPTTQPMQQPDDPPNEEENDSSQDVNQVEELDPPNEDDLKNYYVDTNHYQRWTSPPSKASCL
jgi:hypothetical protein